eukprot:1159524-Pelagomonas_calceolata.AAC.6
MRTFVETTRVSSFLKLIHAVDANNSRKFDMSAVFAIQCPSCGLPIKTLAKYPLEGSSRDSQCVFVCSPRIAAHVLQKACIHAVQILIVGVPVRSPGTWI